jgi:hypothetical protein
MSYCSDILLSDDSMRVFVTAAVVVVVALVVVVVVVAVAVPVQVEDPRGPNRGTFFCFPHWDQFQVRP